MPRKGSSKIDKYKDEIFKMYFEENKSLSEIAGKYNTTYNTVHRLIKNFDPDFVPRGPGFYSREYSFDEYFLDDFRLEIQAYWLGFFYADGTNIKSKNKVSIKISSVDEEILLKFKEIFKSNHPIKYQKPKIKKKPQYDCHEASVLEFCSKHFSEKVAELGGVSKKTYILQFPDWIPENLMPHFIRGYFDGDGGLSNKGENAVHISFVSTKKFLRKLKEILERNNIRTGNVLKVKNADKRIGSLHLQSKKEIIKFFDYIYKDATIYLERKHTKFIGYFDRGVLKRK